MHILSDESPPSGEFQERHAFLDGSASESKKILAIGLGETSVSFGDVRRDRKNGTIQLITEKTVAAWEDFGLSEDNIRQVDRLLVDDQFFECEGP